MGTFRFQMFRFENDLQLQSNKLLFQPRHEPMCFGDAAVTGEIESFEIVQLDPLFLSYFMEMYVQIYRCVMVCVCNLVSIPLVSEFCLLMFTSFGHLGNNLMIKVSGIPETHLSNG